MHNVCKVMAHHDRGFTCYWRIENFVLFKKNSDLILTSPTFKSNRLASCFCLKIHEHEKEFLGVYLCKVRKPSNYNLYCANVVSINYSVSLLLKTGWITVLDNIRHKFITENKNWGVEKLVSWKKLEKEPWTYLPSGCLTVKFHMWNDYTHYSAAQLLIVSRMLNEKEFCHLPIQTFFKLKQDDLLYFSSSYEFKNETKTKQTQTDISGEEHGMNNQEDILRLFQEKKLCFVTLKTSQKEFMVHKAILCAVSPVFKVMFEQDMQEKVKNIVNIDDIDAETMTMFMQFLHMESVEDLNWDKTVKLYYVADKYQIEHLKILCTSFLQKDLSVSNICEAFIFADMHQNGDLKQSGLNYFIKNSKLILRSEDWKHFLLNHTELAADILHNSADDLYHIQKS